MVTISHGGYVAVHLFVVDLRLHMLLLRVYLALRIPVFFLVTSNPPVRSVQSYVLCGVRRVGDAKGCTSVTDLSIANIDRPPTR